MMHDDPVSPEFARFLLESAGWTPQIASAITYALLETEPRLTTARIRDVNNAARLMLMEDR